MKDNSTVKCTNCGGNINVDSLEDTVVCKYCDATLSVSELLSESDNIRSQKINARMQRDIELGKQATESERMKHEISRENQQRHIEMIEKFKKSKFSKIVIVFAIISLIAAINSFANVEILAGLVAIVQAGLYIVSWLMGMQFIKEKRYSYHILPTIAALILIVPYSLLSNMSTDTTESFEWTDMELHQILPEPDSSKGELHTNSNNELWIDVVGLSESEYNDYIDACIDAGFSIDAEEIGSSYDAYNNEGYKLGLSYYSSNEEMSIMLESPAEMSEIVWPTSDIAKLIPVPKSSKGDVYFDNADGFAIYLGETPIADYNEYVQLCSEMGFSVDYDKGDHHYYAYDESGHYLSLKYEGNNIMFVKLEAPDESEPVKSEPPTNSDTPESDEPLAIDESEPADEAVSSESSNTELIDGMRPEFKEAMDSYEAFFDEYIEFMNEYNESDDVAGMMVDYVDFLAKYAEAMEGLEELESQEMNDAELAYYTEVTLRINEKLLEVL